MFSILLLQYESKPAKMYKSNLLFSFAMLSVKLLLLVEYM